MRVAYLFLALLFSIGTCYDFRSEDGILKADGSQIFLRGASWFGFETPDVVPHGLWSRSMSGLLDFLRANGFNALRLPFSATLALNPNVIPDPSNIDFSANPDLVGLTAIRIMDLVVDRAAQRGILVLFDMHRLRANAGVADLWYDQYVNETQVKQAWSFVMNRYKNRWNVLGADIINEPHGPATWGTGNIATDWRLAAERIGNHVLGLTDSGLVFVQGVESTGSVPEYTQGHWWGGNLEAAGQYPVRLSDPTRLVYSPHVYGPSVYNQDWFRASNFPLNMPPIWTRHFGYVANATGRAVVVSEWGGRMTGSDAVLQNALADYLLANGMASNFWWCLNPNSGDTGGLLQDDWLTPIQSKLDLLKRLVPNPTVFTAPTTGAQATTRAPTTGAQATTRAATTGAQATTRAPTTGAQATTRAPTTGAQATTRAATTGAQATTRAPTTGAQATTRAPTTGAQATTRTPTTGAQATTRAATTGAQATTRTPTTGAQATTRTPTTGAQATTRAPTTGAQATTGCGAVTVPDAHVVVQQNFIVSWMDGPTVYRQYELIITNSHPSESLVNAAIHAKPAGFARGWNVNVGVNVLSFPEWLVNDGGLPPGASLFAGFITADSQPALTLMGTVRE